MKYTFTGSLEILTTFTEPNSVKINTPFDGVFCLPSEVTSAVCKSFTLELQASGDQEARLRAEQILSNLVDWLSVSFDVPVKNQEIKRMVVEGSNTTTSTISLLASYAIVKQAQPDDILLLGKVAEKLQSFSPERSESLALALSLYREGRASQDNIKKFWSFYRAMIVWDKIANPEHNGGERKRIDDCMKALLDPALELFHNDHDGKDWTAFTAIRDSFSHEAQFSNVHINIASELAKNVRAFEVVVRKALLAEATK